MNRELESRSMCGLIRGEVIYRDSGEQKEAGVAVDGNIHFKATIFDNGWDGYRDAKA